MYPYPHDADGTEVTDSAKAKNKTLLRVAGIVSMVLDNFSNIDSVGLTGSLARGEDANDVDLVVLTKGNNKKLVFSACINGSDPSKNQLSHLPSLFPVKIIKFLCHICEITSINPKLDLIFAHHELTTNCELLNSIEDKTKQDFYKRLFCELPYRQYDPNLPGFKRKQILHKEGECCKAKTSWDEAKTKIEKGEMDRSPGAIDWPW